MAAERDFDFKFEKLTAENYHNWKFNMKMFLIGKDLWEIVQGTETLDENATAEEKRKFKKRENMALASVCLSVSTSLQIYVRSADTGKDAWDCLAKHFQQKTLSRKIQLRRQLYSMKLEKGCDMVEHINSVKTVAEHLEAIGDPIAEHDLVIILISSLNEDFNFLITALETIAEENLTFEYVRDRLIHEAEKLKNSLQEKTSKDENNDALLSRYQGQDDRRTKAERSKELTCHYCKEKNHFARDCVKKKADENTKKDEKANLATDQEPEIALKSTQESCRSGWWIDSGASQHMTYDRGSIDSYQKFKKPLNIQLADDSTLQSFGKGEVRLTLNGKEKVKIVLKEVLYVPKMKNKLFSLPSVTEKGAAVEFKGQSCNLKINGKCYTIGQKRGKMYKLNTVDEACYVAQVRHDIATGNPTVDEACYVAQAQHDIVNGSPTKEDIVDEQCQFYFDYDIVPEVSLVVVPEVVPEAVPEVVPDQAVQEEPTAEVPQRPQCDRKAPDRLGVITGDWWEFANIAVDSDEPQTHKEALSCEKAEHWRKAIDNEMNSLVANHTWDLVDLPEGKKVVGSRWVFKEKQSADGEITKYRIVAQDHFQENKNDYDEFIAPDIDSLNNVPIGTRPDLSYSVGVLSQFVSHSSEEHRKSVFQGTLDHCLAYVSSKSSYVESSAYTDADWAGDKSPRVSVWICFSNRFISCHVEIPMSFYEAVKFEDLRTFSVQK